MHATVCDIIADLVQNSVEAGASLVELIVQTEPDKMNITVADNGKGMDEATLAKSMDPFYSEAGKHDHRRVGLGLPLLMQTVEASGGKADIRSEPGKGTTVEFNFDTRNIDMPPFGDLSDTALVLMASRGEHELILRRTTPADAYTVRRSELIATLGDLETSGNLILARQYMRSQEQNLIQ
ncbi:MAG: sensor histidine kinase [Kiritimatiellae bacterium]|nr:sensor histidine kinase [Kiritimatiellia bacterium]